MQSISVQEADDDDDDDRARAAKKRPSRGVFYLSRKLLQKIVWPLIAYALNDTNLLSIKFHNVLSNFASQSQSLGCGSFLTYPERRSWSEKSNAESLNAEPKFCMPQNCNGQPDNLFAADHFSFANILIPFPMDKKKRQSIKPL